MRIYRFVISLVFFCMYSLPTEIKDKTQVKQFGQVPLKIDQALFLCIFQRKLVTSENCNRMDKTQKKIFSMILNFFSRFLGTALQFGELVSHYYEAGKILLDL